MATIAVVSIGQRIKAERRKRLMTQDVLASEAGISQKALSKIENDEVEPRVSTLRAIALALRIEATDLFDD